MALIVCQGFFWLQLSGQTKTSRDTLIQQEAPELEIKAFSFVLPNIKQPLALYRLDNKKGLLSVADGASFQNAMNTVPGVYFESRGNGGSPRLNIRGSMFRSAFGVRNVRMYWEDFVLTSPDGTTPMEVIDPFWVNEMEIIKGPSGVQYGNGTGGVVQMRSHANPKLSFVRAKQLLGQWGSFQQHLAIMKPLPHVFKYNLRNSQRSISIYASRVGTQGYRQQENNARQQVMVVLRNAIQSPLLAFRFSGRFKGENISVFQWYQGGWQLPGSLNQQEMESNPQQARPYSISNNASLYRQRWMYGVGQNREYNRFTWTWRAAMNGVNKVNPYGTSAMNQGYKDEHSLGTNTLARLGFRVYESDNLNWDLNAGGEGQWEDYHIREAKNVLGAPGATKYDFMVNYSQRFYYLNSQWRWKDKWVLQSGIAKHTTQGEVKGEYGTEQQDGKINWNPGWTPRWAISYQPFNALVLFTSKSWGFSNPNAFEQVDFQNNRYNAGLGPEKGNQWESGVKWNSALVSGQLTYYKQNMTSLIVPVAVQVDSPLSYSNNASAIFEGWEMSLNKEWTWKLHQLDFSISGHKANYHWMDYSSSNSVWNGKRVAGNALHSATAMIQYQFNQTWFVDVTHYWVDKMPLNNDNSVYSHAYNLSHIKLARVTSGKDMMWKWEIGVNNAMNTAYTSFWQWNDASARYYNPSSTRNFYIGLTAYFLK